MPQTSYDRSQAPRSARRHALIIGLGEVSTFRYGRSVLPLPGAVADARALADAFKKRAYESVDLLVNHQATTGSVSRALLDTAGALRPGSTFVLAFSGHGLAGRTRAGFQQSWCLFDRPLLRHGGDGLDALLSRFQPGVRILVIANCCHSGSGVDSVATPSIIAEVIRVAACGPDEFIEASQDAATRSPLVHSLLSQLLGRALEEWNGLLQQSGSDASTIPRLEMNEHTSRDFLRSRPFC